MRFNFVQVHRSSMKVSRTVFYVRKSDSSQVRMMMKILLGKFRFYTRLSQCQLVCKMWLACLSLVMITTTD